MTSPQQAPPENYTATPFLKWAGGKSQLLSQFADHYPTELEDGRITRYVEPFLGGGAVFFEIAQRYDVAEAYLSDVNAELILIYRVVQQAPERLLERLQEHHETYYSASDEQRKEYFYRVRDAYNEQRGEIDHSAFSDRWIVRAANMVFLNKTCFNGLYRVNSSGEFNVPTGRYKRPAILDEENILKAAEVLQMAELHVGSFETCEAHVTDDTFVYFDPPYRPLNATSNFTSYSRNKFDESDQIRLAKFYGRLDRESGAKLMLSNSDPANVDPEDRFFDEQYGAYEIHRVNASRMINSNADKRGQITELLITNY